LEGLRGRNTGTSAGTSQYRGVIWHKSNSKWEARIYEAGKQRFLGYFASEVDAARAYDMAALKIGAMPNFAPPAAAESLSRANSAPAELQEDGQAAAKAGAGRLRLRAKPQPPPKPSGGAKGSSKYRGVSWNSNCCKWRAQVWKGNDVRHLGYFEDEIEAAKAYDRAVLELRGPNAQTNFQPSSYWVPGSPGSSMQSSGEHGSHGALDGALNGFADGHSDIEAPDSLFLGVSWDHADGSWKAELWDGKDFALLGHFNSEEEAARAYDRACLKQHGDNANTNYPPGDYETERAAAALVSAGHHLSGSDEDDNGALEMSALEGACLLAPLCCDFAAVVLLRSSVTLVQQQMEHSSWVLDQRRFFPVSSCQSEVERYSSQRWPRSPATRS
jgi:hypothetical protein